MGFFKRLFTGDICPIDNIVRKTPEYQDAMHQVTVASLDLEKTLTPEQLRLFHRLSDAKSDMDMLLQSEAYRLGFMDGMAMKQEIQTDEKAADG